MANDLEIRIGAELTEIKGALAGIQKDLRETGTTGQRSGRQATQGFDGMERTIRRATNALAGFISVYSGLAAIRGLAGASDEFARLNAQLRLTTDTQEEFVTAQREVIRIAQETRAPVADVANTYAILQRSTSSFGVSQEQLVAVLETVNKAIALTPVSAETARASLVQFGQALANNFQSGAQELNSLLEQTPGLAIAVADGLGVPVAALKRMGEEGELSTERVFFGLQRIKEEIDKEFTQIPLTVGGAMTQLRNDMTLTFGEADVSPLIDSIQELRNTLTDPAVQEGLLTLASGLTTVASAAAQAAAGIANVAAGIGEEIAVLIHGPAIDDLPRVARQIERIRSEIEQLERARSGGPGSADAERRRARIEVLQQELAALESVYEAERQAQEAQGAGAGETAEQRTARLRAEAEARMEAARAAQEQANQLKALQREQEAAQKQIEKTIDGLQEQVDTFGMSADEVTRYRLAALGATEAEIERAVELARTIEQLEAKAEAEKAAAKAAEEAAKLQERLAEELEDVQIRQLEATGRTVEATRMRLEADFRELIEGLQQTGNEAGVSVVRQLIDTEVTRAQFEEIKRQFDQTVADLQNRQQQLADQVTVGAIMPALADEQGRQAREQAMQELAALTAQMHELAAATGDQGLVAAANDATAALQRLEVEGLEGLDAAMANLRASWAQLQRQFAQSTVAAGVNATTQFFTDLATGSKGAGEALRDFARSFALSMVQIASRALATYAVLQMLDAVYPGAGRAAAASMGAGVLHKGGMAGTGPRRQVSPLAFVGAPRYHNGGMVGIKPGEVPAILQTGEEVLARDDPRNAANGGGAGTRIINVVDPSMAGEFLDSPAGERAILNVINRNSGAVRQTLGG